ncbi:hypothetical protein OG920_40345 [Streptomyces europaeiscabiei]|nr:MULTISPECIES: hypothetical protein [Streptomyces]MDX3589112.1 hypothetical protein [Streptomyces europaeiscabiei]MDX3612339.1 hypothetical protein [Streptomyces europaeiscabiei]MDX3632242.1 hypothetical protein [Streptomyces europaeiscabiei]MDX3649665.1 hypothetical protein [Streptomyces europaeiscabiei]WUD37181.1 hypothetical protein OG858_41060 [Streptomyces europaeiscabiei]
MAIEKPSQADLLVPEQPVGLDGPPVLQGRVEVEAAVDVDGQPGAVAVQDVDDGFDRAFALDVSQPPCALTWRLAVCLQPR